MQSVHINGNTSGELRLLYSAAAVSAVISWNKQPFLPQLLTPLPWYYRSGQFQHCGKFAVFLSSPLSFSSPVKYCMPLPSKCHFQLILFHHDGAATFQKLGEWGCPCFLPVSANVQLQRSKAFSLRGGE